MRQRLAITLALMGCVLSAGAGSAAASALPAARPSVTRAVGLAGYHFSDKPRRILVRGDVTVPTSTCGRSTRSYQIQVGAGFTVNGQHENAVVLLLLRCRAGKERAGVAELIAGFHAKMPATPITAGQTVRVRVVVYGSRAVARIAYPDHTSAQVSAGGGRPTGAVYALTLPNYNPPQYAPVAFTACQVNRRPLSSYHPSAWKSVTKSGRVDGKVSAISGGTNFTIAP